MSAAAAAAPRAVEVLALVDFYLPGYKAGGPIRTVANMVRQLRGDVAFRIATRDRDFGDRAPYPGVARDGWSEVEGALVSYLSPRGARAPSMRRLLAETPHDVLYLNSFFSPRFSVLPLLLRRLGLAPRVPVVLAPRGELGPGALALRPLRKRFFLHAVRPLGLYQGVIWQASAPQEEEDVRRWFGAAAEVCVAPDLRQEADPAGAPPARGKEAGRLRVVFVSRIDRKKNLAGALRLLRGLSGEVEMDVYGPPDDPAYDAECRALAASLGGGVRVRFHGALPHEQVRGAFARAHVFLFPTLGENFGHVVLESLLAGCPVAVSDRTPWLGLEPLRAGWDLPLEEPERFRAVLQTLVDMDAAAFSAWSEGAWRLGVERSRDRGVLDENRALFRSAAGRAATRAAPAAEALAPRDLPC